MRKLSLQELGRVGIETYRTQEKFPIIVYLDNVRSGLNVGSILRSCDAFNVEGVLLSGITPSPPHKEILKTAIGASNSVFWQKINNGYERLESLKRKGYSIIGIEQTTESTPLRSLEFDKGEKVVLVFGNEVGGLSEEIIPLLDAAVEIRQFGTKHSLNVAVCAGIVLWHCIAAHVT